MPIPPACGPSVPNIHKSSNSSRKGRKRKAEQRVDTLKEKLEVVQRVQKLKTTQELVQAYNLPVTLPLDSLGSASVAHESTTAVGNASNSLSRKKVLADSGSKSPRAVPLTNSTGVCDESNKISVRDLHVGQVDDDEKRTKSELMQRFLSSASATNEERAGLNSSNYSLNRFKDRDRREFQTNNKLVSFCADVNDTSNTINTTVDNNNSLVNEVDLEIRNILSQLPPLRPDAITCSEEEQEAEESNEQRSPRLSLDDSDAEERVFAAEEQNSDRSVSDSAIDRIANERWECVNGTYNSAGEWREWQQMTDAYNPSTGELLHILPYVNTTNW